MKENKIEKKFKIEAILAIIAPIIYFVWTLNLEYGGWLALRHFEYIGLLIYFTCVLLKLFNVKLKVKTSEWILMITNVIRLLFVIALFITNFNYYTSSKYHNYKFPIEALIMLVFQVLFTMFLYEIISKKTKFINNKIYLAGAIIYCIYEVISTIIMGGNVGIVIIDIIPYILTLPYFYEYYKFLKDSNKDYENEKKCEKCGKEITISEFVKNDGLCGECLIKEKNEKDNPQEVSDKDWVSTLLLCLFTGAIGGHNFYVGKNGKGILYLFTGGVLGIGTIIDFVNLLTGDFKDADGKVVKKNNSTKGTNVINQVSSADELKKYKELLDANVITQEEFDKKKKQLLNL